MFQASLYENLFVPIGSVSAPRNRLALYKCPKGYLSILYEKAIIFSNCTNMRSKREAVILKLNNILSWWILSLVRKYVYEYLLS